MSTPCRRFKSVQPGRYAFFAVLLSVLATQTCAADDSADQRFLAGLRQRGLFRLAETYCRDRLRSEPQRDDLVIELSRCLAERAVSLPADVRRPIWQEAIQVTGEFARDNPQHPRLPLVRFQAALGLLARGELARQEAQVSAQNEPLFDEARTHLRAAVRALRELADDVARRLQGQSLPGHHQSGQLSTHQLSSLQKNIQYQLARAFRNQAQCYEANGPDWANSLTQAVELLDPLAKLDPADPLAWKSRIDLISSYRLLSDYAAAGRQLAVLLQLKPPPAVQLRVRAERIRLALATDRLPEAIAVLSEGRLIDGTTSAELDYAWLQTYLDAGRAAREQNDNSRADQWQSQATDIVEQIEQLHGPYWTRRAGMLLSHYVRGTPQSGDLDMLVRVAESSFRSGRPNDAVAAYDDARQLAEKQGNAARAFELGFIAATIEHQQDRHGRALQRYRAVAAAVPRHPKAPEAHLLAIHHAAQLVKDQQAFLDDYTELLQEHLRTWPDGPTADKVRRRLGRLREHRRNWTGAIEAYRAVSPSDADYCSALEAVERCTRAWLEGRKAAGEPAGQIVTDAADAAAWFESRMVGPQGSLPEKWNQPKRLAALTAARLRLNYTPAGYDRAQSILAAALQGADDAKPEWTSAARAMLVFSLAGGGRHREASEVLSQLSAGPPEELLNMLQGLSRVAATARPQVRRQLAELQLRTIELLRPRRDQLSPPQQQSLRQISAAALADAGRTQEALTAFRSLSVAYPRNGAIQEAYAKLLLTRNDRASMEVALQKWRELENKSPPHSPRWFLAKYWVARLHFELGNRQQAAKIIKLMQLLQPDSGGAEMKRRFDELLKQCGD